MSEAFENTTLWRRTLAEAEGHDRFAEQRSILRNAYFAMRKNAAELVKLIPQDCKGLTVHDVTHLDALWETADLICGDEFVINPAEAFVFGAAVLIHDAGMSIAAFPGGLKEITQTTEWTDAVYSLYRKRGLAEPTREALHNPPTAFRGEILFNVLRTLHARQAEALVGVRWSLPSTGEQICLLENQQLRVAYGRSIGRIAHSHHWDLERLNADLRSTVGAQIDLPGDWTVNEIKLACMLRCADATHIDHRRAPTMLYALSKPKGESEKHWSFQHKLNKATVHSGALLYSSGQDFELHEAPAWWLCFDTIRMIDSELSTSNALLQDIGTTGFALTRVYGAESPRILARFIRPNGWRPVDADIRVSHPAHLARTLGGANLYGRGAFAPIRELLQNGVDAVRARRKLEDRPQTWGTVKLTIENATSETGNDVWLHVDDQGIGMSERVLVGALLDFGRSIWNSPLLQEEFPGLESRGIKPIGKFGIGFFSVFLLGEHVRVITRKYTAGLDDTKTLEFSSLDSRPILRPASSAEVPTDYITRVSVKVTNIKDLAEIDTKARFRGYGEFPTLDLHQIVQRRIRSLVAALDVRIEIEDKIANVSSIHAPDWEVTPPDQFIRELLAVEREQIEDGIVAEHSPLFAPIEGPAGEHLGRAALWLGTESGHGIGGNSLSLVSVGGFVYPGTKPDLSYLGVMVGDTNEITRSSASAKVSPESLAKWASRQAELIDPNQYQLYQLLRACHTIVRLNGDPRQLPFCYSGGKFISLREFEAVASASRQIYLPLNFQSYSKNFNLVGLEDLGPTYFVHKPIPSFIAVEPRISGDLFDSEEARTFAGGEGQVVSIERVSQVGTGTSVLIKKLEQIWGKPPTSAIALTNVFSDRLYRPMSSRWVVSLSRSPS